MSQLECMTTMTDPARVSDTMGRDGDDTDRLIRELQGWVITLSITLTVVTALLIWVCR